MKAFQEHVPYPGMVRPKSGQPKVSMDSHPWQNLRGASHHRPLLPILDSRRWRLASSKALQLAHRLVRALEDKKGEDILVLDISELTSWTECFVLCSGVSDRMLETLQESALEAAKKDFGLYGRVEGEPRSGWVLVDFGDVILHLFTPEVRRYYDLEDLWADGKVVVRIQ